MRDYFLSTSSQSKPSKKNVEIKEERLKKDFKRILPIYHFLHLDEISRRTSDFPRTPPVIRLVYFWRKGRKRNTPPEKEGGVCDKKPKFTTLFISFFLFSPNIHTDTHTHTHTFPPFRISCLPLFSFKKLPRSKNLPHKWESPEFPFRRSPLADETSP